MGSYEKQSGIIAYRLVDLELAQSSDVGMFLGKPTSTPAEQRKIPSESKPSGSVY
jgi:hypothetical protein